MDFSGFDRAVMQIRSIRVVYHHTLLGVLADRGIRIHAVAEWCRIPTKELCRLLEFGSPLGAEASERLVAWGTRMIEISKPETRATRLNRVGDESPFSTSDSAFHNASLGNLSIEARRRRIDDHRRS